MSKELEVSKSLETLKAELTQLTRPRHRLWLCKLGLHLYVHDETLYIGRRKQDHSWDPLWYFQVKRCSRCGRVSHRWVGEARTS